LEYFQKSLSLAISTKYLHGESQASYYLGHVKFFNGDYSAALRYTADSQRAAKLGGNLCLEANAARLEAMCLKDLGDYQSSLSQLQRAKSLLVLCDFSGSSLDQHLMSDVAIVHGLKSEYNVAHDIQMQLLQKILPEQDVGLRVSTLLNLARSEISMSVAKEDVEKHLNIARHLSQNIGWTVGIDLCDYRQTEVNIREGNISGVEEILEMGFKKYDGKDSIISAFCLEQLSDIHLWDATRLVNNHYPTILLGYALKLKKKRSFYKALQSLGDSMLSDNDQKSANSLFAMALDGFTQMDIHRSRAECMLRLGNIAQAQGDVGKAEALFKAARPLFERSSQTKRITLVDEKLSTICVAQQEHTESLSLLSTMHAPSDVPDEVQIRTDHGVENPKNLGSDLLLQC
jgi:tetratricopeptide (TPR) repeat protein